MKPFYEVNRGEYLVGSHIEAYRDVNLWMPARDTGVDLLVSDRHNRRTVSMQVKYSKDYLPEMLDLPLQLQRQLRACSWLVIDSEKLLASRADLWVLVLFGFESHTHDFLILPPEQRSGRLRAIHGEQKRFQTYFWVTKESPRRCWEARDLVRADEIKIGAGDFNDPQPNFTKWLNNWSPIEKLDRNKTAG